MAIVVVDTKLTSRCPRKNRALPIAKLDCLGRTMRITPVVFQRVLRDGIKYLTPQPTFGCEWVLDGAGTATAKYDGRPLLIESDRVWTRYVIDLQTAPDSSSAPIDWRPASQPDETLRLWPGWIPMPFDDPLFNLIAPSLSRLERGSYEAIGPGIGGNPHGRADYRLVPHGKEVLLDPPRDFARVRIWLEKNDDLEGIVWHHPDGSRAKIRRKDFGLEWPSGTPHNDFRRAP